MFLVALLLAAGAPEVQPAPAAATPPAAAPAAKPKKICRTEQALGSILPKHTCRTQQEWDAMARATEGDAEALRRVQGSRGLAGSSN
jgi:hypothetical protein